MQIGQLNHLDFPKSSNPLLAANTGDDRTAAAEGSSTSGIGVKVRALTPAQDAPGVILKLEREHSATPGVGLANGLVYSDGRKAPTRSDDAGDTERMAALHSQALQRSAGSATRLTLDKDGVLVAGAASTQEAQPTDFVTFAVHAMRDFADEQDRLKNTSPTSDGASLTSLIPRSLAEVQKLAARFKLFA
jgi:hypothetical protein